MLPRGNQNSTKIALLPKIQSNEFSTFEQHSFTNDSNPL